MATNVNIKKRASTVFLSSSARTREALLGLNMDEGMKLFYGRLDSLFKVDTDQVALLA